MGDLDLSIDAFKHLPYFKPLYTTILRQQMQYLTEQLSKHAGEECLVLTANLSAGTISSLTSMYGAGFLNGRPDIKTQFTKHCAKNKMKFENTGKWKISSEQTEKLAMNSYLGNARAAKRQKLNNPVIHKTPCFHPSDSSSPILIEENKGNSGDTASPLLAESQEESDSYVDRMKIKSGVTSQLDKPPEAQISDDWHTGSGTQRVDGEAISDKTTPLKLTQHENSTNGSDQSSQSQEVNTDTGSLLLDCSNTELFSEDNAIITLPLNDGTDDKVVIKKEYLDNSGLSPLAGSQHLPKMIDGKDTWIVAGSDHMMRFTDSAHKDHITKDKESKTDACSLNQSMNSFVPKQETINTPAREPNVFCDSSGAVYPVTKQFSPLNTHRFNCCYCDKTFTTFASQKRHERKHTGEFPFACDICDMKFYRKDDLNVHLGKHQGLKPYQCNFCFAGFSKKKILEEHITVAHQQPLS